MAVGSIYKVSAVGRAGFGQLLVNTWHYRAENATIFDTQSEDLAQAWDASLSALFRACFSNSCLVDKIEVRGVTDPTEGFDFIYTPPPPAGGITGDPLPGFVSAVIKWTTGLVGRRFRGRSFMWPAGEVSQNNGEITGTYQTTLDTFADAAVLIGDGITTSFYQLVIHSEAGAGANTPVTGHTTRSTLHVQRRRTLGVGA